MAIVFLDRDGVINRFPGRGEYVTSLAAFEFLPRSLEAIAYLTKLGHELFVISNQGCVSRGLLTLDELNRMTEEMVRQVESRGGRLAGIYYCPHQTADNCECKKPKTTLFRKAVQGRLVDFQSVYFVGDSKEDFEAGQALGCRVILVLSGRLGYEEIAAFSPKPACVKKDLWEAAQWIADGKS